MKKLLSLLSVALMAITIVACSGSQSKKNDQQADAQPEKKTAVVYFSVTGNTKKMAEKIAEFTKGELIEIAPEQPYTPEDVDYKNEQARCTKEMTDSTARPAVKKIDKDLQSYDVIFLGYPIWWDIAPRTVNTFIESNDLKGKTVIPFATSGNSAIEHSVADLRKLYPEITFQDGLLLNGATDQTIQDWLKTLD